MPRRRGGLAQRPAPPPPAYEDAPRYDAAAAEASSSSAPRHGAASLALYLSTVSGGRSEPSSSSAVAAAVRKSDPISPSSPQSHTSPWSGVMLHLLDQEQRRVRYTVRIPRKREGWKADVASVSSSLGEKRQKLVPCYEVRRETLARRIDLRRQPDGTHNIMLPSMRSAFGALRSYTFEAQDGQSLVWQRSGMDTPRSMPFKTSWSLVSQPSMTVLARYVCSSPNANDLSDEQGASVVVGQQGALQGTLDVSYIEEADGYAPEETSYTSIKRTFTNTSTASAEEHGRLARSHKQPLALGVAVPGILAGSVASSLSTAAWSRNCILGDDIANLGRATVSRQGSLPTDGRQRGPSAADAAAARRLADLNRVPSSARKSADPRPRNVDLDLIVATLIAVLDA